MLDRRHLFAWPLAVVCTMPACYEGVSGHGGEAGTGTSTGAGEEAGSGTGDETGEPADACAAAHPGDQVVRRLSNREYSDTLRDLFGPGVVSDAALLPYEGDANGFTNDVSRLTVAWPDVQAYLASAELVAKDVAAALPTLLPCAATAGDAAAERACAEEFVARYGPRLLRRPLAPEELESFMLDYDDALALDEELGLPGGLGSGVGFIVMRALQSPDFLYRLELGGEPLDEVATQVTSWEMASRLSYLVWGSMPDDELFAAAEADALRTPEQVAEQVERMLADPRARSRVRQLYREWLHLGAVTSTVHDPALLAGFDAIKPLLITQAERFAEHVVFDSGTSDVAGLLTAPVAFVNADVAPLYGIDPAAAGLLPEDGDPATDEWTLTELDPAQRAGIFTHPAILAALAKPSEPAPVLRGKFLLEQLFCNSLPPPPPDLMLDPPPPAADATTRERWEGITEVAGSNCIGCHSVINAPGHALGHYDAAGRFITEENGKPIDASGSLSNIGIEADFEDAVEMLEIAARDPGVQACIVRQHFHFAYGREPVSEQDRCTMDALAQRFAETEGDLRDLLVAMTTTDAFLYRPR